MNHFGLHLHSSMVVSPIASYKCWQFLPFFFGVVVLIVSIAVVGALLLFVKLGCLRCFVVYVS